jgi:hypothetical protein
LNKSDKSKWARIYAKWREASGGKWWLYQYFKIADYEIRKANPKKPRMEDVVKDDDCYHISKKR